ncbi:MAG: hypothetical protein ACR2MQ_15260 [Gemmatimonadaceae bacterium]
MKSIFAMLGAAAVVVACGGSDTIAPIQPNSGSPDLGTMAVGDVRVLSFADAAGGLQIPASLSAAQYAVILANTNVAAAAIPSYTVHGDWMTSQARGPSADLAPPTGSSLPLISAPNSRGAMFEASLRNFERTQLPRPGGRTQLGTSAAALDKLVPPPARAVAPPLGATLQIKVLTPAGFNGVGSKNCSAGGYTTTTGKVRAIGRHALVVSDVNSPAGGFTDADFQGVADEFDSFAFPTDSAYFGSPTDLDNNGHIIIYYTPAVNSLTPAGEANKSGYVGGFFFAGDLYPPTGTNSCASSNRGEIFYLLAPDPNAAFGNSFTTDFVREATRGTVAHEFQHMINSGNRYISPVATNFEATWLDEGLAHMAEDVVGRARAGFADNFTVAYADVDKLDPTVLQAYFIQNFARAKYYALRPDTTGAIVSSAKAAANLASRCAVWALRRYLDDWFSGNDPRNLTRKLVAGPDTGSVNLVKSAGAPLDTLLSHWLVTMYTDHRNIPGLNPMYNYKSYTLRQLIAGTLVGNETTSAYLPVKAVGDGRTTVQANIPGSSANFFLTSLTTGGARTIAVTNSGGSPASDPNGRIYVVRQQ